MAVSKKQVAKKVVVKKEAEAPAKKVVAKKAVAEAPAKKVAPKKAEPAKKVAPKKEAPAKTGKKTLTTKANKTSDSFKLVEGKQATQDAFINILYNKLTKDLGYDAITKEDVKKIHKACSETLKEVTNLCSFQDTTAGIYYARRVIEARVTNPPKANDGLQTLMLKHYELKVRKVLANEEEIKFSGTVSEDDPTIFITTDGKEIKINDELEPEEEVEVDEEEVEDEEVEEEVEEESDEDEELFDEDEE